MSNAHKKDVSGHTNNCSGEEEGGRVREEGVTGAWGQEVLGLD